MKNLFLIFSLLFSQAVTAAERLPSFPRNTTYGDARNSLIGLGWQPITLPESDECQKGDNRCKNRPEMHACSGSGLAHCIFIWKKNSRLIEVVTAGEDIPVVTWVKCRAGC